MDIQSVPLETMAILHAFSRALRRESHVLTRHPELLWQQLYNRLQWEGDEIKQVLAPELAKRKAPGAKPWARTRTPFRDSEILLRTLTGHHNQVNGVSVSLDGSRIVSASHGELKLWDTTNGQEVRTLHGPSMVFYCAYSPDGVQIVSAHETCILKLWEAISGRELRTFTGHELGVRCCAFSPDGTRIVSSSVDDTLSVWNTSSGWELRTLRAHTKAVTGCAFSPDGSWIVSASWDNTLKKWDTASGRVLLTLKGHSRGVNGCGVCPDGTLIVSASEDETLKVWDAATGQLLCTLEGHTAEVLACGFSPDGTKIVSASKDHTLKVWEVASGKEISTLRGHSGAVLGCAFSPDGLWIVSASSDCTLKIWDANFTRESHTQSGQISDAYKCAFSPDGTSIVYSGGILKILDFACGKEFRTLRVLTMDISDWTIDSDSRFVVSTSHDRNVKIWDIASGSELLTLSGHYWGNVALSPDGSKIVFATKDRMLKVWEVFSGKELLALTWHSETPKHCTFSPDDPWDPDLVNLVDIRAPKHCTFSPDNAWVIATIDDNTLRIWDATTGKDLHTISGHNSQISDCFMSPDGTRIFTTFYDKTVKIWDAVSWRELHTLAGHTESLVGCAVSPDGLWVLSVSSDHMIKIWDADSGLEVGTLRKPILPIRKYISFSPFSFSPDGVWLIFASTDDTIQLWNMKLKQNALSISLLGDISSVALHPWLPYAVCSDQGGSMYLLDLVGIDYEPIIVTAVNRKQCHEVRCPACQQYMSIKYDQLGNEMTCPTAGCGLRLKINPFVINMT